MNNLLISKLEERIEIEKNNSIKEIINILLAAVNDWPVPVVALQEYELQVRNFIESEVTKENLKLFLSTIDYITYSWESESLCEFLEIYNYVDNNRSLKEIIKDLEE